MKELVEIIISNQKTRKKDLDGGMHVGFGGVAYMLWFVSTKIPEMHRMEAAKMLAEVHLGIFAVNAAIATFLGDSSLDLYVSSYKKGTQVFLHPDPLEDTWAQN
eukprot:GFUD01089670.1.p1 GENE.GFUD01089670.1~~GFUD01089670.1.p1  ORF type:complete len:104 (-),score=12.72 GFUD01089670.1:217-528(-)